MKKLFILFLAFLFLAVSSGLAVEIHHCIGKISDITLIPSGKHTCEKCGMAKGKNECCKDELKFVKLQDSHKLIIADYQVALPDVAVLNHHCISNCNVINQVNVKQYNSHSPPSYLPSSLCILNCVFRI